jgi:rRNA-processing protein FCF1
MSLILCDTDFLIKASTQPLPELAQILSTSEYQLATLPKIEAELKGLLRSENKVTSRKAKTALESLDSKRVKVIDQKLGKSKADADVLLVEYAAKSKDQVIVATLDHSILSVLEKRRLPYLTLRKNRPFFRSFESATYLLHKGQ